MTHTKIGTREFAAVILLAVGSKLGDMTPAMLAQSGKNAYWLIPIISFSVFLPSFLVLLYILRRYETKHLIDLVYHLFGKYAGFLIGFILFSIVLGATVIDSRSYIDEISGMYFDESPLIAIYIVFMAVAYFGAKRGFEAFASTAYLLTPYIKLSLIFLAILLVKEVVWLRVFPIFGDGITVLLREGILKASLFGDLLIFTMAYTSLRDSRSFHRGSLVAIFIVIAEMTLFFLLYCTLFDYKSIDKIAYPFQEATRFARIGTFFTNIETIYLIFWLQAALIRFVVYLYFTAWVFGALFKCRNFESFLLPFAFIILSLGMIPENQFENVLILRNTLLNYASFIFLLLPYLLWIVAKIKGELKKGEV